MRPCALVCLPFVGLLLAQAPPRFVAGDDPAREFFASGAIVHLGIAIDAAGRQQLQAEPRSYVPCTVKLDGKVEWQQVGVKLKGAAGSFRELGDKPGLTLKLDKFGKDQALHGLHKFHLNNSVQDDTWLCEWLGAEVFAAAGLPAPRVLHARVVLDGRDLGLYVLREAYDRQFLVRAFGTAGGNLYDGGFCQDVDGELQKDAGDGPDDRSDLQALAAACNSDAAGREPAVAQLLDTDAFVDFVAVEAMLGHWDGYSQNRNNYRLWCEPGTGRAHFLPHGMDQLYGDVEASVLRYPTALVASALLQAPAWRQRYRQRLSALLPLFAPQRLQPKLTALAARLRAELHEFDPAAASAHASAVRGLQQRIDGRYRNLQAQCKAPEPKPVQFDGDRAVALKNWHPAAECEQIELAKKAYAGAAALQIACCGGGDAVKVGAWRTSVLLAKGRYRLAGVARGDGVVAGDAVDEGSAGGASLRVDDARSRVLSGTEAWLGLECEFTVAEFQREVELALELRAAAGRVWFKTSSLQLTRLPD